MKWTILYEVLFFLIPSFDDFSETLIAQLRRTFVSRLRTPQTRQALSCLRQLGKCLLLFQRTPFGRPNFGEASQAQLVVSHLRRLKSPGRFFPSANGVPRNERLLSHLTNYILN